MRGKRFAAAAALGLEEVEQQDPDAFRAGGYDDARAARYIARIKQKIAQGLELTGR